MKKTNKLISILLVLVMLLSMAPVTVFAATVEASGNFGASGSNLTWSLDSDSVLTISGNGAMQDFANAASVPWYSKRTKVKTVVIESGVTNIGKDAFYGISALVNATISDTVTSIGNRAFSNSGLTNFEFSDAGNLKTIGNSAFNSTKIKSMVIPDGVTTLGSYVFGYGPIKSVTIPASVTSVGNYFFEEATDLNEVIFLGNKEPETIGNTVFLACSSLAYVSVPADYEGDTFSNMKVAKAAASVAEVNGQGFTTLADAVSAAQSINGAELKLLSHISIDSGITIESGNFTIDLNGKELFSNGYYVLRVDGADVTIVDSAGGGIFNATNDQGNIVLEVLSGSANISGGTFNSVSYPVTVKGGLLKITSKDFIFSNGNKRIGWYGGIIDLSACTADEVRIQPNADELQASAVTLPDGWGLFKTNGTPYTDFVKYDTFVAKAGCKVTAFANPAEGGTVEGAGTYSSGATVTLTASAANGYRFVNWTESGVEVSTSAVYAFTVSENRELTANFEIVPHTHSFTYTASGDTITAVCTTEGCGLENGDGGYITISAPADLYADGTTTKEAVVDNQLADTSVTYEVTYSTADRKAPTTAGTYTASVTIGGATASVQFEIIKRSSTAENFIYTAPENLVYDGTPKYATVEVSPEIMGMGEITVSYYQNGEAVEPINAGTYTVKVSTAETDKYYAINNVDLGTFTINTKDISDAFIILGDALTYNGTEQTQTVEKVLATGTAPEVTYTVSGNKATNVGVYLLTVTGTGNFSGEAKIAYEIAVDASGIEGLTPLNVKSSDKAKIEYVYNQLENAVTDLADSDKRAEWDNLKSDCVEMLALISDTADEINRIIDAVAAYDINTVTGDDVSALVQLADDTDLLLSTDNLTAEEREALVQTGKDIQRLISIYDTVSAQLGDIKERMNRYDEATVKSSDKADIEQLKADIKELTDGQNLTAAERVYLVNADAECDKLLEKIAETKSEYDRVIAAANGYDKATVTSADRDALDKLRIEAYTLSDTDNVTTEEKENLQIVFENLTEMVETLINVGNEIERIVSAVGGYDEATVKYSDYKDILQLIDDIKALTDGQNITEDERANLEELNTKANLLAAKIRSTADEIARITNAVNTYNINSVKSSDKAAIENLIARIKKLTDGDNITADERNQLNSNEATINALLAKIRSTADEIARIEDAVNSYDEATVKSTDKADLEKLIEDIKALTDATNITEEERTELGELDTTVDSLIKKIDDTAAEIERIDEAVNAYDEETVKSSDEEAINKLKEDIQTLIDGDNLTEEEKAALEDSNAVADALTDKIADTKAEIDRINEVVNAYDEDTVKSTDKDAIEQLKDDIQALIDSGNVTYEEFTALEEKLEKAEALTDKIAETEAQLEEIADIENNFKPEDVTSDDKAAIEDAIAEIEAVNPDNLTDEQKAEYEEIKTEFEKLLDRISAATAQVDAVGKILEVFDEERVTIFWEDEIEALKAKIDGLLADENMGEAEKAKLNEYKAECDKLIEIIHTPVEYFSLRLFYFIWDCLTWKCNGILWLFSKIFGFGLNTAIA